MTTLYVDRRGVDLDLDGEAIVIRASEDRVGTAPLRLLERVVIRAAARVTVRLLARLADRGIGVLLLSGRSKKPGTLLPARMAGDPALRLAQYAALLDEPYRERVALLLVAGKIWRQIECLRTLAGPGEDLRAASIMRLEERLAALGTTAPNRASLRGIEGTAAATYFPAFASTLPPSLRFHGRNRRPPRDPVNACLSLGYTLIHFEAARQLAEIGLDPMLGMYHEPRAGREALASDLIEPSRAAIDAFVWRLFRDRVLRVEGFTLSGEACMMSKSTRKAFYRAYEEAAPAFRHELQRGAKAWRRALIDRGSGLPDLPDLPDRPAQDMAMQACFAADPDDGL
ncbi:MAG: CRISPR-associated endonuclease Cas1 [Neomegalonema sp.]|nr:CRISPR-associated endonuclease Cas1 [Neomegalonema sp.]